MNLLFKKQEEYTSPKCRVYSVNLEKLMLVSSPGEDTPPAEEDPWGELGN